MSDEKQEAVFNILESVKKKQMEKFKDVKCKDCGELGHPNKAFWQCAQYGSTSSAKVGSKRKRMSDAEKQREKRQKKEGKCKMKEKDGTPGVVAICSVCGLEGHSNARSSLCPEKNLSKEVQVKQLIGEFTSVTRKVKLSKILRPRYKYLIETFVNISKQIREIMVRAQIFVNSYFVENSDGPIDKKLFTQNCWYCITQLIVGRPVTNTSALPLGVVLYWEEFSQEYDIKYNEPLIKGYSQCLSPACQEVSTAYANHIVELFEQRSLKFLLRGLDDIISDHAMADKRQIAEEYCYPKICGNDTGFPEVERPLSRSMKIAVDNLCNRLLNIDVPRPITVESLASSPGSYTPIFTYILQCYEKEHQLYKEQHPTEAEDSTTEDAEDRRFLPRLFTLCPEPSFKFRSIPINPTGLKAFTTQFKKTEGTFSANQDMFFDVFDLSKMKLVNFNTNIKNRKTVFSNLIRTDGFCADIVLYHQKKSVVEEVTYTVGELNNAFDENNYSMDSFQLCGLDPGRTTIFTAAYGAGTDNYEIRRCSRKEYNSLSGSTRIANQENKRAEDEGVSEILKNKPTPKTASHATYKLYIDYIFSNMQSYFDFYGVQTGQKNFYLYQGRQRARDELANILTDGGKKYNRQKRKNKNKNRKKRRKRAKKKSKTKNRDKGKRRERWRPLQFRVTKNKKIPIIGFGDGMKGKDHVKIRGQQVGVVDTLYKQLKRREKEGRLLVTYVDEFRTSKVCHGCKSNNMTFAYDGLVSVLACQSCGMIWNRDSNAAENIFDISAALIRGSNTPLPFQRPRRT